MKYLQNIGSNSKKAFEKLNQISELRDEYINLWSASSSH